MYYYDRIITAAVGSNIRIYVPEPVKDRKLPCISRKRESFYLTGIDAKPFTLAGYLISPLFCGNYPDDIRSRML